MLKIKNIVRKVFFICFILFLYSTLYIPCSAFSHSVDYKSKSLFTNNCRVENKQYAVKKVFDGDTILVGNGEKIRLLGIDAFEHDQNIYGMKGKDFLSKLVLNKNVCIETDIQNNDVYGRTLGYVFINSVEMGQDVIARSKATKQSSNDSRNKIASSGLKPFLAMTLINEELLKNGYAILSDFPPNTKYLSRLKKAQIYARENMLGVWSEGSYIKETPSQWRHEHPLSKKTKPFPFL